MSSQHSIPPLRDLPRSSLVQRKEHLMAEVARERKPRLALPAFSRRRPRVALIAAAGACGAAGIAAFAISLSGSGPNTSRSPFLAQSLRGPVWSAYPSVANWGGGALSLTCSRIVQVVFGCKGILTVPATSQAQPVAASSSGESVTTVIEGGSVRQQRLLQSIIDGMQPNAIMTLALVSSRAGVTLRMRGMDESAKTLWQESLVAAAFRDRAKAAGGPIGVSLENGDSNGALIPPGPATALPAAKPGDAESARERVQAAAAKTSADLSELVIYQPDGVAVALTLKTGNPAAFLVHEMPAFLADLGDRWQDYDGVFVRLIDDSGATVWETSSVGRTQSGSVGSREDLAGCSPVANWGSTPPPCPEK
jgi:hypothetical protein